MLIFVFNIKSISVPFYPIKPGCNVQSFAISRITRLCYRPLPIIIIIGYIHENIITMRPTGRLHQRIFSASSYIRNYNFSSDNIFIMNIFSRQLILLQTRRVCKTKEIRRSQIRNITIKNNSFKHPRIRLQGHFFFTSTKQAHAKQQ